MYGTRMLATILSTAAACTGTCLAQEQPSASKLTTLFTFAGLAPTGEMVHDATGAIYGAAVGGEDESGAVVEMAPPTARGGEWAESVIHSFGPLPDGSDPSSTGLVFGNSGRLYGTTFSGGNSAFGNLYHVPRHVRIDRQGVARIGRRHESAASHTQQVVFPHHSKHPLGIDLKAELVQLDGDSAVTIRGPFQSDLLDVVAQFHLHCRTWTRRPPTVISGSAQAGHLAERAHGFAFRPGLLDFFKQASAPLTTAGG